MTGAGFNLKQVFDGAVGIIKSLAVVIACWLVLFILIKDFNAICDASQKLLARAGSLTSIKALGVEVAISDKAAAEIVAPFNPQFADGGGGSIGDNPEEVAKAIAKLEPEEFVRLMEVGLLDNLCEFERPTAKMRGDVALDYRLQEKGLVTVAKNEAKRAAIAVDPSPDIGRPFSCYDLYLTGLGRNVKTVLVQSFKSAFNFPRGQGEPAANSDKLAAR